MTVGFKLLDSNLAFKDDVVITATSSDNNFPASNMKNPFRSAVWRSSGNFIIDATNDRLDFDEGTGELTATIASASYSPAALASEIETKMEAVGSESYTVSYSTTTLNFTITSDTGVTLDLLFVTGTNTAISIGSSIGFTTDQTGSLSFTGALRIHTEEAILFDLQTAEEVDSIVLLFPKSDGIRLTSGAVVTMQANPTSTFTAPAFETVLTIDEDFEKAVTVLTTAQEYRYWRLKIVDPTNSLGFVEMGNLFFQLATDIGRAPNIGFTRNWADTTAHQFAASGHKHSDIYPMRKTFNFTLGLLEYLDTQTLQKIYRRVGSHTRVCIILDSGEELYQIEDTTIYGTFATNLQFDHVFQGHFNVPTSIVEEF